MSCDPKIHCVSFPFPKRCRDFCIERILRAATPSEKVNILNMRPELAHNIFQAYNIGSQINSFAELKEKLSDDNISEIRAVFSKITVEQFEYFKPRI